MKQTLKRAWTVTLGNPQLKIGLVLLCILLLVALFAPVIAPYDPYFISCRMSWWKRPPLSIRWVPTAWAGTFCPC